MSVTRPVETCQQESVQSIGIFIVGGSGRFFGPVIGTIIIILLPELLRSTNVSWLKFMQTWYLAVFGVAVVALMIWLPGGILSIGDRFKAKEGAK